MEEDSAENLAASSLARKPFTAVCVKSQRDLPMSRGDEIAYRQVARCKAELLVSGSIIEFERQPETVGGRSLWDELSAIARVA